VPIRILAEVIIAALLAGAPSASPTQKNAQAAQQAGPQPIPRASFIGEMDSQFRKMDADKNGQLTRIEIEQFQKLRAVAEAEDRNRALFAELDTDKNKQLSPAEFARLVTAPPPANATPMLQQEDANKDNQISLIEHRTATLANFDRIDADKDGVVTPAEMRAGGITR
jgi:Ca2+-binding EF-hand superfamily protein